MPNLRELEEWKRQESIEEKHGQTFQYDPESFIDICLANFEAKVGDYGTFESFDGRVFVKYAPISGRSFELNPETGVFHLYAQVRSGSPGNYNEDDIVYRGRCEIIGTVP